MARGQYFQAHYDEHRAVNHDEIAFDGICDNAGPEWKIVLGISKSTIDTKVFRGCDFVNAYDTSTFKRCRFELCDFNSSRWDRVKFSGCTFERCNFALVEFRECVFVDCGFVSNSVSGNELVFRHCSLEAYRFLSAVMTNVDHLPPGVSADYQQFRLKQTIAKVATTILNSTREEPDLNLFFEAHREFVLRQLEWKAATAGWNGKKRRTLIATLLRRLPVEIERAITMISGWLTDWGRSLVRPMVFGVVLTLIFALAYWSGADISAYDAIERAVDVTIVAGYTRHDFDSGRFGAAPVIHVILAIYWYSLIGPVVVRRTMR